MVYFVDGKLHEIGSIQGNLELQAVWHGAFQFLKGLSDSFGYLDPIYPAADKQRWALPECH